MKYFDNLVRIFDLHINRETDISSVFAPGSTVVLCCSKDISGLLLTIPLAADASRGGHSTGLVSNPCDVVIASKSKNATEIERMLQAANANSDNCYIVRDAADVKLTNADIEDKMSELHTLVIWDELEKLLHLSGNTARRKLDEYAKNVSNYGGIAILIANSKKASEAIHSTDPSTARYHVLDAALDGHTVRVSLWGNPKGGQLVFTMNETNSAALSVKVEK